MGMTERLIDIDEARKEYSNLIDLTMSDTTLLHTLYGVLDNAPTVEAIPKSDYENRLKADLVAMLTDFLMDIEENTSINSDDSHERNGKRLMRTEIIGMFEQKINKLKENNDV